MQINDPVIGSLELNYVWTKPYLAQIFQASKTVELNVEANDKENISEGQQQAYKLFDDQAANLIDVAVSAVYQFYVENRDDFIEYIDEDEWSELAPEVSDASELEPLISLQTVRILKSEEDNRRVALFFSATFEDELGVSVLFVNEQLSEVVTDVIY
jgi:hypothetical protein